MVECILQKDFSRLFWGSSGYSVACIFSGKVLHGGGKGILGMGIRVFSASDKFSVFFFDGILHDAAGNQVSAKYFVSLFCAYFFFYAKHIFFFVPFVWYSGCQWTFESGICSG